MSNYCLVQYDTGFNTIGEGWIVEEATSPLTGKLRFRVCDTVPEARDPEAGKWFYSTDVWEPEPRNTRNGQHLSEFI